MRSDLGVLIVIPWFLFTLLCNPCYLLIILKYAFCILNTKTVMLDCDWLFWLFDVTACILWYPDFTPCDVASFPAVSRGTTGSSDGLYVSTSHIRAEWKDMMWVVVVVVDVLGSVAWWSYQPVVTICVVSRCYWPSALPLLICISSMSQWRGAMAYGYGNEMQEWRVDGQ